MHLICDLRSGKKDCCGKLCQGGWRTETTAWKIFFRSQTNWRLLEVQCGPGAVFDEFLVRPPFAESTIIILVFY